MQRTDEDVRSFEVMNAFDVQTKGPGPGAEGPHQEDSWLGREVAIGEAVVRVTKPDARCVITTQDPDSGQRDFPTLHVIRQYRGLRDGRKLDFGVYADVVRPGRVAVGDTVMVTVCWSPGGRGSSPTILGLAPKPTVSRIRSELT